MGAHDDRTQQVLQQIAKIWLIDDRRISWVRRTDDDSPGFDWWPGDFRVRVRAHPPPKRAGDILFKLIIRTDFLKDVDIHSEKFEQMAAMLAPVGAPAYAWVHPRRDYWERFKPSDMSPSLWLHSSGYISSDNIGWMPDLLAQTGIMQPINAQIQAGKVSQILGGAPDTTRPAALRNAGLDGILEVIAQIYAPAGKDPSRWAGTDEFEELAKGWSESGHGFGSGDASGMILRTWIGNGTARIRLTTELKNPQLGHGLLATLHMPCPGDCLSIARAATELNFVESFLWTEFPQLGCWHPDQPRADREEYDLTFSLFVPNWLYQRGLADWIVRWFIHRARWASPYFSHD